MEAPAPDLVKRFVWMPFQEHDGRYAVLWYPASRPFAETRRAVYDGYAEGLRDVEEADNAPR